jgi:putative DNA primase/helicase
VLRIDEALRAQATEFAPQIHRGGLSSREGLAALIHDGYRIGQQEVPAIEDKRLWVVESEFANVLQQSRRGGNTLSMALRDCWDGVDLKPATKSNRVHATAPHVCLSGAISPAELLSLVQRRDLLNGFANRFLMVWGERTQIQPFPKRTPQARVETLARRVTEVLAFVREKTEQGSHPMFVVMAEAARTRYAQLYQTELNQELGNTLVDSVLERRAPMLLRLAMILALADLQWQIEVKHVDAAMAWIRYATESACFVFANRSGSPPAPHVVWAAQRISEFLTVRGSASRRDLLVDCFGRHQPATVVDAAIAHLIEQAPGRVFVEVRPRSKGGPGRPATVYSLARN